MDDIKREAELPKTNPAAKRYYVQGVLLTTIDKQYGTEIKSNGSGSQSEVYKINGQLFGKHTEVIRDYCISIQLYDLDLFEAQNGNNLNSGNALEDSFKASEVNNFEIKRIDGISPISPSN